MRKFKNFPIILSDFLLLVFLSFNEKRKIRFNEIPYPISRFKNKKNIFNHEKLCLITELILFSLDTEVFHSCFKKNLYILKKVLLRNNFYIIYKMGSGTVSNLIFSILCKIWFKQKIKMVPKTETESIFLFSREEAKYVFLSLSNRAKIFGLKIDETKDEFKTFSSIRKTPVIIIIFFKKIPKNDNFEIFKHTNIIFIKGEYLFPEYHFSFLRMKSLNLLKNQNCQKVIIFGSKVLKKTQFENCINLKNYYSSFKFFPNQILDISSTQLNKIRRIMTVYIRFKASKVLISSSWSRCLLFCKLSIKTNKKIYSENKNLEIIRTKEQLYLILNFKNRYEYFSCNDIPKKILKKNINIFFYDFYFEKDNIIKFLELLKDIKLASIWIFFLLTSDDDVFFKIIKTNNF